MKVASMLSSAVLVGLLSASTSGVAQQARPDWQRVQRLGIATAGLRSSVADAAGNTYIVGSFFGTGRFGTFTFTSPSGSSDGDGYVLKLDASGSVVWARQITGFRAEHVADVALDAAGNVTIVGTLFHDATFDATTTLSGASVTSPDLFVARYDNNGTLLWANSYGGSLNGTDSFFGNGVALDAAGNSYVAAGLKGNAVVGTTVLATSSAQYAPVLLKLTPTGAVSWVRQGAVSATVSTDHTGAKCVSVDAQGNAVLAGEFRGSLSWGNSTLQNSAYWREVFIARFDASGNAIWAQQSSGTAPASAEAIGLDAAGNAYVTGSYEGSTTLGTAALTSVGQSDGYLTKLNASGTTEWARNIGGSQYDAGHDLSVTPSGDVYLAGSFTGPAALAPGSSLSGYGDSDIFVACYTTQGTLSWAQQAGSNGYEVANTICLDVAGHVYVGGQCASPAVFAPLTFSGGIGSPFIAQLAAPAALATSVVHTRTPLVFSPNPATEAVYLPTLPAGTQIALLDGLGRTIRTKATGASDGAMMSVQGVTPGSYLLRATDPTGKQYIAKLQVQ